MIRLVRIELFPIKSFDGRVVDEATVLANGALEHDRRFAICDVGGRFVNGKRTAKVHQLESDCDPVERTVLFTPRRAAPSELLRLDSDQNEIETFLTDYFGIHSRLHEEPYGGFPDDTRSPGPTVISTETLETVASWFENLTLEETRRRIRANLEIAGGGPFWEDRLFADEGDAVRFRVGGVEFEGTGPCARCVVPTRCSVTGRTDHRFVERFRQARRRLLPAWTTRNRFDHYYRLAVNTRLSPANMHWRIAVGDAVTLVSL